MEGEFDISSGGQPPESERERTPTETAADMLIDGIIRYPATDYEIGAYLTLQCRERSLVPRELVTALLADTDESNSEINRIVIAANNRHDRAREDNPRIPQETITADDIRVVASTVFEIVEELGELTTEEITSVLNYHYPGSESKAVVDDMRRMYAEQLLQNRRSNNT